MASWPRRLLLIALCLVAGGILPCTHASWLIIVEGEDGGKVNQDRLEVRLIKRSHHDPDIGHLRCAVDATLARPFARGGIDTASEHHYNAVYDTDGLICMAALHGDEEKHRGTRSEWQEEAAFGADVGGGDHDGHLHGHHIKHPNLYSFRVHDNAENVQIRGRNGSVILDVGPLRGRRRNPITLQEEEEEEADAARNERIRHVNHERKGVVETTQNIVILAAGYLDEQEADFESDVDMALKLFQEQSFPVSRYFPTMNVFSVFEPSLDEGADRPFEGLTRRNNLGCQYGSGSETEPARSLRCDRTLAISLADTSPAVAELANTLVMVLVNDVLYGGTGLFQASIRMATLYVGAMRDDREYTARSLLYHELGHALADLSDEYVVDAEEEGRNCAPPFTDYRDKSKRVCEKNCAGTYPASADEPLGWQGWIDKGAVPSIPSPGCYFRNFYKPGLLNGEPCLMEKVKGKTLCPVCLEAMTLQLYDNGVQLGNPTCPHADYTVTYIALDARRGSGQATFFMNRDLYGIVNKEGRNLFGVRWELNGVQLFPKTIGYMRISQEEVPWLRVGRYELIAYIEDQTPWVLPQYRHEGQSTNVTWQIEIVGSYFDIVQAGALSDETPQGYRECKSFGPEAGPWELTASANSKRHYAMCTGENNTCGPVYKNKLYSTKHDFGETVAAVEGWILGAGGGMVGGGLGLFTIVWFLVVIWSDKPKRVIYDCFNPAIKYTRAIMVLTNLFFMFLAVAMAVLLMLLYTKVAATTQLAIMAGLGLAILLFITGVTGLSSSWSRKKVPLTINAVITALICFVTFAIAGTLYTIGYESAKNGSSSQALLRTAWLGAIKSAPAAVCSAQINFECSGWDILCSRIYSPTNCPANCEETNLRYEETCKLAFIRYLHKWLPVAGSFMMLLTYLLIAGCVLAFLLAYLIRKSENLDKDKQEILQNGPIEGLLSIGKFHMGDKAKFYANLEKEYEKYDLDGNGSLDPLEFQMFFKASIGFDLSQEQIDLLYALIDIRGTGGISWTDWKEVLMKTADKNPETAINWLIDRKEYAATVEDQRRIERIEEIDMKTPCKLDEENEEHYEQAYLAYGRLDNEAFFAGLEEFMSASRPGPAGRPVITNDQLRAHLRKKFTLKNDSKVSQHFVEKLPDTLDVAGKGYLDWTDWMGTYHARRSAYLELLSKTREKGIGARIGLERQHEKMARLKEQAGMVGVVTFKGGDDADQAPDEGVKDGTEGFGQTLYSVPTRGKEATIVTAKSFLERTKRKQGLATVVGLTMGGRGGIMGDIRRKKMGPMNRARERWVRAIEMVIDQNKAARGE